MVDTTGLFFLHQSNCTPSPDEVTDVEIQCQPKSHRRVTELCHKYKHTHASNLFSYVNPFSSQNYKIKKEKRKMNASEEVKLWHSTHSSYSCRTNGQKAAHKSFTAKWCLSDYSDNRSHKVTATISRAPSPSQSLVRLPTHAPQPTLFP